VRWLVSSSQLAAARVTGKLHDGPVGQDTVVFQSEIMLRYHGREEGHMSVEYLSTWVE
jgi:hypothetical protein